MAYNKEGIAIVLDIGPSMNQAPPGEQTYLQASTAAINMILQRKLFAESKDEVALVLFGTANTANDLADGGSYENITVAKSLGVVTWDLIEYIQNDVQPSNVAGDFLDAIVVAMDHLVKNLEGKRGFASKRLILFSDIGGEFRDDQLEDIVASMKEAEIELNVVGPNLDDDSNDDDGSAPSASGAATSNRVKAKTAQQMAGEALLRHMIELVNGESYSFDEALPALSFFQSRAVRPMPWKCQLEIGSSLRIPISGYIKVKEARPKSFKNVFAKDMEAEVQRLRTNHLNDEAETEVDLSETVEGHRYGSTLVPFSAEDKEAMKYRSEKCFKVLGFTKNENIRRQHFMGDYCMVVTAEKGDEAAAIALSALVNALYQTNMAIIVRRCYSAAASPRIGVLVPHIKAKYECLFYNELPFAEDIRQFTFGSLPVSENVTTLNKKFQPTDEQLAAMDELIDTMDLTNTNGDGDEVLKPKYTFNPFLQRLYQCIQHRHMNPDDPLPELSPVVANYLKPPQEVQTRSEPVTEKMSKMFKLTEVLKRKEEQTGQNMFQDNDKSGEGPSAKSAKLDDDLKGGVADLVKSRVTEVGTVKPIDDFLAIIGQKDEDHFDEACEMMQTRIEQIITDSFGSQFYTKAIDCLRALREQCMKNSEPKMFNDFLRRLKESVIAKGRKDFVEQLCEEKLSLITKTECEESTVTKQQAEKFTRVEEGMQQEDTGDDGPTEDTDDLLGQL